MSKMQEMFQNGLRALFAEWQQLRRGAYWSAEANGYVTAESSPAVTTADTTSEAGTHPQPTPEELRAQQRVDVITKLIRIASIKNGIQAKVCDNIMQENVNAVDLEDATSLLVALLMAPVDHRMLFHIHWLVTTLMDNIRNHPAYTEQAVGQGSDAASTEASVQRRSIVLPDDVKDQLIEKLTRPKSSSPGILSLATAFYGIELTRQRLVEIANQFCLHSPHIGETLTFIREHNLECETQVMLLVRRIVEGAWNHSGTLVKAAQPIGHFLLEIVKKAHAMQRDPSMSEVRTRLLQLEAEITSFLIEQYLNAYRRQMSQSSDSNSNPTLATDQKDSTAAMSAAPLKDTPTEATDSTSVDIAVAARATPAYDKRVCKEIISGLRNIFKAADRSPPQLPEDDVGFFVEARIRSLYWLMNDGPYADALEYHCAGKRAIMSKAISFLARGNRELEIKYFTHRTRTWNDDPAHDHHEVPTESKEEKVALPPSIRELYEGLIAGDKWLRLPSDVRIHIVRSPEDLIDVVRAFTPFIPSYSNLLGELLKEPRYFVSVGSSRDTSSLSEFEESPLEPDDNPSFDPNFLGENHTFLSQQIYSPVTIPFKADVKPLSAELNPIPELTALSLRAGLGTYESSFVLGSNFLQDTYRSLQAAYSKKEAFSSSPPPNLEEKVSSPSVTSPGVTSDEMSAGPLHASMQMATSRSSGSNLSSMSSPPTSVSPTESNVNVSVVLSSALELANADTVEPFAADGAESILEDNHIQSVMGIDTESGYSSTGHGPLELVQISAGNDVALIHVRRARCIALEYFLGAIFSDPKVLKVGQAFTGDLSLLRRLCDEHKTIQQPSSVLCLGRLDSAILSHRIDPLYAIISADVKAKLNDKVTSPSAASPQKLNEQPLSPSPHDMSTVSDADPHEAMQLPMIEEDATGLQQDAGQDAKAESDPLASPRTPAELSWKEIRAAKKLAKQTKRTFKAPTPQMRSLAKLCETYIGLPLFKLPCMSVWQRRVLRSYQIAYAAIDAWIEPHLLERMLAYALKSDFQQALLVPVLTAAPELVLPKL